MAGFQSPLSRGTTPDTRWEKYFGLSARFQSPLSRGTTPDELRLQFIFDNFTMFQSPLSRGTTPDRIIEPS